jgi:hypothetical protein
VCKIYIILVEMNNSGAGNAVANAGAGKSPTRGRSITRRSRLQVLKNNLAKLQTIKNSGKKYKGKKPLNDEIRNHHVAIAAEEEKLAAKARAANEAKTLKNKKAANRKAARSVSRSTVRNTAPKMKMLTKKELASLSKNEVLERMASLVNMVKASAVNNSAVKAARDEAKAIMGVAKAEYEACKATCKARYDVEHERAKAIVERAKMA